MSTVIITDGEERRHSQLDVGDDIRVIYESIQPTADPQTVAGRVVGVEGQARWIIACIDDRCSYARQCYKLTPSRLETHKSSDFSEIGGSGYGHKPDAHHGQKIGEPEAVYGESDLQISKQQSQSGYPFMKVTIQNAHGVNGRRDIYHESEPDPDALIRARKGQSLHTFSSKCEALCHRLFDANGGADCDYEFAIPTNRSEPNMAFTDNGGKNMWYRITRGISLVVDHEVYDPLRG